MSKIRGQPPQGPSSREGGTVGGPKKKARAATQAPATVAPPPADAEQSDLFERRAALNAALETRQQVAAQSVKGRGTSRLRFTDHDLEYLNGFFAALREQPHANRKRRAQMLVKAILESKRKSLVALMQALSEPEREAMGDAIAEALDTSPRYAQLVDTLSEGASK